MNQAVGPLVGAWIEIILYLIYLLLANCRFSRGIVDCNKYTPNLLYIGLVAPLVGAWIEIHMEADGTCLPI